jgi:hypothetical protein
LALVANECQWEVGSYFILPIDFKKLIIKLPKDQSPLNPKIIVKNDFALSIRIERLIFK